MGHPLAPNLDTMTPEQFVHTMSFREQGYTSDKMPQYRDHTEASQDGGEAASTEASNLSPEQSYDKLLTFNSCTLSQPNMEMFWENKHFADCKIVCEGEYVYFILILRKFLASAGRVTLLFYLRWGGGVDSQTGPGSPQRIFLPTADQHLFSGPGHGSHLDARPQQGGRGQHGQATLQL